MARIRRTQAIVQLGGEPEHVGQTSGMQISVNVRAFPLEARPIEVIDGQNYVWKLDGHQTRQVVGEWLPRLKLDKSFVWLDPPQGHDGADVEAALREGGVPVRFKPRMTADAILSEVAMVVAESQDRTTQTMREVVVEMAAEVAPSFPEEDRPHLVEILDEALTQVRL